jgi:hypothetical protein
MDKRKGERRKAERKVVVDRTPFKTVDDVYDFLAFCMDGKGGHFTGNTIEFWFG